MPRQNFYDQNLLKLYFTWLFSIKKMIQVELIISSKSIRWSQYVHNFIEFIDIFYDYYYTIMIVMIVSLGGEFHICELVVQDHGRLDTDLKNQLNMTVRLSINCE